MFEEDDLLPLSGIQHFSFCPRQWALIHLEQVWAENQWTAEGRERHRVTHEEILEKRPAIRVARALPVHSLELGVSGACDVVEFVSLPGQVGETAVPVEYKRGKPKAGDCDAVQLCAQAICLEEMTGAGRKRLRKVATLCENRGQRVQKSVFECLVDNAQWVAFRASLIREIKAGEDSLRFYFLGDNWKPRVEHVGAKPGYDPEGVLIA